MGKRVQRPGGLELTHRLLGELAITSHDSVVEFAPGLGVKARMTLSRTKTPVVMLLSLLKAQAAS
jgi:hypothetical protein